MKWQVLVILAVVAIVTSQDPSSSNDTNLIFSDSPIGTFHIRITKKAVDYVNQVLNYYMLTALRQLKLNINRTVSWNSLRIRFINMSVDYVNDGAYSSVDIEKDVGGTWNLWNLDLDASAFFDGVFQLFGGFYYPFSGSVKVTIRQLFFSAAYRIVPTENGQVGMQSKGCVTNLGNIDLQFDGDRIFAVGNVPVVKTFFQYWVKTLLANFTCNMAQQDFVFKRGLRNIIFNYMYDTQLVGAFQMAVGNHYEYLQAYLDSVDNVTRENRTAYKEMRNHDGRVNMSFVAMHYYMPVNATYGDGYADIATRAYGLILVGRDQALNWIIRDGYNRSEDTNTALDETKWQQLDQQGVLGPDKMLHLGWTERVFNSFMDSAYRKGRLASRFIVNNSLFQAYAQCTTADSESVCGRVNWIDIEATQRAPVVLFNTGSAFLTSACQITVSLQSSTNATTKVLPCYAAFTLVPHVPNRGYKISWAVQRAVFRIISEAQTRSDAAAQALFETAMSNALQEWLNTLGSRGLPFPWGKVGFLNEVVLEMRDGYLLMHTDVSEMMYMAMQMMSIHVSPMNGATFPTTQSADAVTY